MKIDRFYDPGLGWHFHVYIPGVAIQSFGTQYSAFGVWWAKRCDFGVNMGRREFRVWL